MSKDMLKKLIGGAVALILIGVGVYYMISSQSVNTDSNLLVSSSTASGNTAAGAQVDTRKIIQQLNQLREIDMDTDIFNTPTFLSLQDPTIELRSQPIGRENPFVPPTYVQQDSPLIPAEPVHQRPVNQDGDTTSSSNTSTNEQTDQPEADTEVEADTSSDDTATTTQENSSGTSSQPTAGN